MKHSHAVGSLMSQSNEWRREAEAVMEKRTGARLSGPAESFVVDIFQAAVWSVLHSGFPMRLALILTRDNQ